MPSYRFTDLIKNPGNCIENEWTRSDFVNAVFPSGKTTERVAVDMDRHHVARDLQIYVSHKNALTN